MSCRSGSSGAQRAPCRSAMSRPTASRGSTSTARVACSDWAITRAWFAPMLPAPTRALRFTAGISGSRHGADCADDLVEVVVGEGRVDRERDDLRDDPLRHGHVADAHEGMRAIRVVVEHELRIVDAAPDAALAQLLDERVAV